MLEVTGVGREWMRWAGLRNALRLALLLSPFLALLEAEVLLHKAFAPGSFVQPQQALKDVVSENFRYVELVHIRQHNDADTLPGEERGQRAEAIDAAAVMNHGIAPVGLDYPSHGVVGVGHFRVQAH